MQTQCEFSIPTLQHSQIVFIPQSGLEQQGVVVTGLSLLEFTQHPSLQQSLLQQVKSQQVKSQELSQEPQEVQQGV
jgi:hypothetical protein